MNNESVAPLEQSPLKKDSAQKSLDKTAPKSPVSNSKVQNRSPVSQSKTQAIPTTSTNLHAVHAQDRQLSQEKGESDKQPEMVDLENGQLPAESDANFEKAPEKDGHGDKENALGGSDGNIPQTLPREQMILLSQQEERVAKGEIDLEEAHKQESQGSSKQKQGENQLDNENDVAKKEEKIEEQQANSKHSSGKKTPASPSKRHAGEETTLIKSEGKRALESGELEDEPGLHHQTKRINV